MQTTAYYAVALSILLAVSLAVAFLAWRRRSVPGSIYFALMMLAVAVWSASAAIEVASADQNVKVLWLQISYIGVCTAPTFFLFFALKYWRPEIHVRRLYRVGLWIIPAITILIAATNDLHHLLWTSFAIDSTDANTLTYGHGVWFWINVVYSYAVMLSVVVLLSRVAISFPRLYRRQSLIILIAAVIPWIGYAIYVFGGFPPSVLVALVAFTLTGVIFALGMLKLQLFDIVPVARDNMIQYMDIGMLVLDYKARIVDFNSAAVRIVGRKPSIGLSIGEVLDNWQGMPSLSTDTSEKKEIHIEQTNPSLWLDVSVSPLHDSSGRLSGHMILLQDITKRKQAEEALILAHNSLEHQAMHDPLTGILNRRAILDALSRELARARRQHVGLAIGICDIDHFKKINDTYGHPVGDEVLCGLVRTMESNLRQYDLLGRFGGEEFLVLTPGVTENDVITVYQRLVSEAAQNSLATKSGNVSVTISIGVKVLTGEEHMDELLKAADEALYDAKNGGRNRVFVMHDKKP